ncbi:MAG TPA: 1-(5-phosphoribosyl)-5-[(5-phosphoribosylamino)methylideneamino]imidazole-4-carboxamide isomerase [Chloroflexota bacterium]|nr:1-(5-phosphoribosyl)-5-[(5-phosphoribosylamino)methylideneamino]imidazole-4-carboxamide isomerase [Chloroflexota bacterium]
MPAFEVIPALDLRAGRLVRLYQGDYQRERVYSDDPVAVARAWAAAGAPRLHVVDLDGAREGVPQHLRLLEAIAAAVPVPVQFGGGIRTRAAAEAALRAGADRLIVGTAAVDDPALVQALAAALGPRLVLGIDARDGLVATHGWRSAAPLPAPELAARARDWGVQRLIYTDIARDGTLTEPNYAGLQAVIAAAGLPVIASGGIARVEQLCRLRTLGAEGAIVGTALYEGTLHLADALAAMRGEA